MKVAVIGHPVAHSKSPLIHQYWMNQSSMKGVYNAIDIAPENLKDGIQQLIDQNYNGFNVTVPHKEALKDLCDEVDDIAQAVGAVNTVIIQDKKLIGTNTDVFGFIQNIKSSSSFNFDNKTAFVLGAGGAARAVIYGLVQEGITAIKLTNRTAEKAVELQSMAPESIEIIDWDEKDKHLKNIDILVNTTSLGMVGKPTLTLSLKNLPKQALVSDIVYAPLMTDLLTQAQHRGNEVVTGIGMLLHQARPAFQKWAGILPDVTEELIEKVLK